MWAEHPARCADGAPPRPCAVVLTTADPRSNKRRTFVQDPDEAMQERIKRLRIASRCGPSHTARLACWRAHVLRVDQRSDPFDTSSVSAGAASSSSPTSVPPHPGLARAWANSERGQPAVWPPASAGQPPDVYPGHPETPIAHHPFAHHPYGAGVGCGCAAARLVLLVHDLLVV